jgi:hypothetical protein
MSKEDAGNGLNVEFLESIADGSRKATNAEMKNILGGRAWNVAEKKSEALRATIGKFAQELRAMEQEDADTAQICDAWKEFAAEQVIADIASIVVKIPRASRGATRAHLNSFRETASLQICSFTWENELGRTLSDDNSSRLTNIDSPVLLYRATPAPLDFLYFPLGLVELRLIKKYMR